MRVDAGFDAAILDEDSEFILEVSDSCIEGSGHEVHVSSHIWGEILIKNE